MKTRNWMKSPLGIIAAIFLAGYGLQVIAINLTWHFPLEQRSIESAGIEIFVCKGTRDSAPDVISYIPGFGLLEILIDKTLFIRHNSEIIFASWEDTGEDVRLDAIIVTESTKPGVFEIRYDDDYKVLCEFRLTTPGATGGLSTSGNG